jgi:prepilin-type N-terminal cleavage/methylation domain-containing protein
MLQEEGFTLVELAIVLVIIALLAGGLTVGQSMIAASRLRAVSTEAQNYITAIGTFQEKYAGLPGDITNATTFWGDNPTACSNTSIPDGSPGTCNGDGNNITSLSTSPNANAENMQMWNQLASAGLIEGRYAGVNAASPDSNGVYHIGTKNYNVPSSAVKNNALWSSGGLNHTPPLGIVNSLVFYRVENLIIRLLGENFSVQEVWNLDKKMDDGKPGTGIMFTNWGCSTGANANALTAPYNASNTTVQCSLYIAPRY